MQTAAVDALTINEASATTGWSARMLRYIETIGLVQPCRSGSGYRLYGPAELQRLSSLRELLDEQGLDLGEVGFALRLERDPRVRAAIERWLAAEPARPKDVSPADWLRFEQEKHQRLLATAGAAPAEPPSAPARSPARRSSAGAQHPAKHQSPTTTMETA